MLKLIRGMIIGLTAWLVCGGAAVADTAVLPAMMDQWDVSQPRGHSGDITFSTDEGTWMSLDISPDGRWIVFDLLGQIFRIPTSGGQAELLASRDATTNSYHPRYSPDGKTIVFVSDRRGQDNLWLMDADGSRQRALLLDLESRFVEPAWTPDGRSIVVTRRLQRPGMGFIVTSDTLWTVSVPDGHAQELVGLDGKPDVAPPGWGHFRSDNLWNGADRHQWPAVSPDGRFVYFHTSWYGGNPRHIQRIELATRHVQDVTESKDRYSDDCCAERPLPNYLTEMAPELSPDGHWLAFARRIPEGRVSHSGHEVTGRTALWLRDLRTGAERLLMDPITRDAVTNLPNYHERVLPGYAWARDSASLVIPVGGKIRRVWLSDGHVETVPFQAEIHRRVSQMARGHVHIEDKEFTPRYTRWPQHSPAGRQSVFEAAGTLWIRDSDNSAPHALDPPKDNQVQLTPAWSMAGDAVAFTAAIDAHAGSLQVVDLGRKQVRELLSGSTPYMRPSFSRDGKWVYFDRWPAALVRTPDSNEWELARIPREGGTPELVAEPHAATWGDPWYGDVRFFVEPGPNGMAIERLDLATRKITEVVRVAPGAIAVTPSPDHKWLAVEQAEDVYVVPVSAIRKDTPLDIFAKETAPLVQRITKTGGRYAHWRANSILELASASDIVTYDPSSGKSTSHPAGLVLPRSTGRGTVVFKNARLLTMGPVGALARGDVVVRDSRILCVGNCSAPAGAKLIEASGKTIMPGLFDVHAHAFIDDENDEVFSMRRAESAAYLAYGVTTIHDPFGSVVPTFSISDAIESGRMTGPRTYTAGGALTCLNGPITLRPIRTLEDALEHIDRKMKLGVISIKDYLICNRIQRQMLTEAARMRGITVTNELGPLYYLVGQAVNGDTGWEHMIQTIVYKDVTEFFGRVGSTNDPTLMLSDFSNGLALERWYGQTNLLTDPKAQLWTPWQRAVARRLFVRKPDSEYIFPWIAQGDAAIKAAGGHVAVGGHGEADGIGTHWEIWTQRSGMSAQQTLEAATMDSARFLGLEKELGSLEPGKIADLIVLEADPMEDIHNTMKIDAVMKAGKLYDAHTLDELWPQAKPYGTPPWLNRAILQTDVKQQEPSYETTTAGGSK